MQFRHYLVSGRVQGVSFRVFAQKCATELGLLGWVRNLRDGRVEILAAGSDATLEEYEELIARGPTIARVDSIEKRVVEAGPEYNDFRIRETQEAPWPEEH